MDLVWYLIINSGTNGGMVSIPQRTEEQCVQNAKFIHEHEQFFIPMRVWCVPGVKP
jgi:hypothetical protein